MFDSYSLENAGLGKGRKSAFHVKYKTNLCWLIILRFFNMAENNNHRYCTPDPQAQFSCNR